jgi:pimeloyl-ACP methyl ester carboxylesterase
VTADDIPAAAEAMSDYAPFMDTGSLKLSLDICALGDFRTPLPNENEPVFSDVPVLLLAGEYDFGTPPAYAERIATTLGNAFVYTIPYAGHDLMSVGPCPRNIGLDFLDDPTTAPDTSCLDELEQGFTWAEALPSN